MAELVIMPEKDYKDICDAVRAKTGGTELLKSGDIPAQIEGIQTGGSSEEWYNDGNTHIWITLGGGRISPMLGVCVNGTVTVDWGDGTEPDVLTGTSISIASSNVKWTPNHEYAKAGDYVISLSVDGEMSLYGSASSNQYSGILRHSSAGDVKNNPYRMAIRKVEIGNGITSISNSVFHGCSCLSDVRIPNNITSIGMHTFNGCYCLSRIIFPNDITRIGTYAFASCHGTIYYDFSACTSVPTLENINAFNATPDDFQILVPAALYDEWNAATNWATYASYMVAV